jgi:hypothetical protein
MFTHMDNVHLHFGWVAFWGFWTVFQTCQVVLAYHVPSCLVLTPPHPFLTPFSPPGLPFHILTSLFGIFSDFWTDCVVLVLLLTVHTVNVWFTISVLTQPFLCSSHSCLCLQSKRSSIRHCRLKRNNVMETQGTHPTVHQKWWGRTTASREHYISVILFSISLT